MKSEIIDRILSENSEPLHKIIETVKNNAVFQDVMSNIKEEFFINDSIHGISHNERVALLSCYIGIQEGLDTEELKLVLEAAKYHDIGRGYEGNHGKYSTIIIDRNKEYIFPDLNDNEINIIKALCHGHSVDDSRYEEIAKMYNIINIDQFKKLLNIVKDADALDRVRLPRFGKLDEKYLRTETAHEMIELAENLYREYRNIQQEIPSENKITESKYTFDAELRNQLLFDGENYYLLRSLNSTDIDSLNNGNGIIPKTDKINERTVKDVMAQIRMQHRKTNLISMSEDPNIVLTYDKSNLHRFVLIKLSKEEIENSKKVFSAGEYLLGVIDSEIERIAKNAPKKVREILENVDRATSIDEIVRIINGADRQVPTSLVEVEQQYLSNLEQLKQSKKIAKCKVLNYYGLMRGIAHDERGKLLDISEFTRIMRNGYSSSEWLYSGEISQDKIINIPQILIDSLALLKQAEFQGKDKEILIEIEQEVLKLAISGEEINQDDYMLEYSAHNDLKNDLTIDRAYEITNGQISYRDTNMQQIAIRSLAEMTLNKRKIIELLKEKLPNIDIEELLSGTYCINQEMVTKQNNRGNQIGRNINFLISEYGYDFEEETSRQILESVENLKDEQLNSIISQGVNAQEIRGLLIKTRENDERIQTKKSKTIGSKYIAEAIIEGYNWKKDGNSLTKREKELMINTLLKSVEVNNELYKLYEAINKIQIEKNKFTQNDVFAIMINLAIDGKIGEISYSELLKKDIREIQLILLDNREKLQTSVLPISIDLLAGKGKEIDRLKKELIDLGIDKGFIESKDIKNVYVAKQIVDEYKFERELTEEERRAILKSILRKSGLNKENTSYLNSLIHRMEQIGLNRQQIYGMIINLGINGVITEDAGYSYSYFLGNNNNVWQTIAQYKDEIQTEVTEGTILKARTDNLSLEDIQKIKEEFIELGVDKKIIDEINEKNLYAGKQIVDQYKFRRKITKEENRAILEAVLGNKILNRNNILLTTLIYNMEQIGFDKQEIYGMIINAGINGRIIEREKYAYVDLLQNNNNVCKTIDQYKDEIQTEVTEGTMLKAKTDSLKKEDIDILKKEMSVWGIEKEFINSQDIKNLYVAKQIIEQYNSKIPFKIEEKKSILKMILSSSAVTGKGHTCYLVNLIQKMEQIGLNEQQIYGMIINLGINGKVLEEKGYGYRDLLTNSDNACQTIAQYKNQIQTEVTEGTISKAKADNLTEEDIDKLNKELVNIGLDKEFIELKDASNLYIAKQIIYEYDFKRELTNKERKAVLKLILNNAKLNKNKHNFLSTLIQRMEQIGLNKQQIYGMIINLGINGTVTEKTGYDYSKLLANQNNACQTIAQYKDEIQTKVSEVTILKAKTFDLDQQAVQKVKDEFKALRIDKEFIDSKSEKNLYIAKQIIDGYVFKRALIAEEKKSILEAILNQSCLNKDKFIYLIKLIQNLEQIGLNEQQIYGMIINLSINGRIIEETGYNYKVLLNNKNNACQTISQYRDQIQTEVTEETIQKAVKKANKPKKVKGQDIAKATMELTAKGSGGSQICDDVQADYMRLLDERTNTNQKEGSEQGGEN